MEMKRTSTWGEVFNATLCYVDTLVISTMYFFQVRKFWNCYWCVSPVCKYLTSHCLICGGGRNDNQRHVVGLSKAKGVQMREEGRHQVALVYPCTVRSVSGEGKRRDLQFNLERLVVTLELAFRRGGSAALPPHHTILHTHHITRCFVLRSPWGPRLI